MTNPVVHFEIHAVDQVKMAEFYKNVFGWEITKWENPMIEYRMVMTSPSKTPGAINGGITSRSGAVPAAGQSPNAFVCTVGVEDVDACVKKVLDNGGKVTMEPADVPSIGRLAYCTDIENNHFGIIKPVQM